MMFIAKNRCEVPKTPFTHCHSMAFSTIAGGSRPGNLTVTIRNGEITTVTGVYTA